MQACGCRCMRTKRLVKQPRTLHTWPIHAPARFIAVSKHTCDCVGTCLSSWLQQRCQWRADSHRLWSRLCWTVLLPAHQLMWPTSGKLQAMHSAAAPCCPDQAGSIRHSCHSEAAAAAESGPLRPQQPSARSHVQREGGSHSCVLVLLYCPLSKQAPRQLLLSGRC